MASSHDLGYWYSGLGGNVSSGQSLPNFAIPDKKKGKKWLREVLDAFETIGMQQVRENLQLQDYIRMVEGEMSHTELGDSIPTLKGVGDLFDKMEIPTFIKHYDLLGVLVRGLTGEFSTHGDTFSVTNNDPFASNEYERTKTQYLRKYFGERLEKELQLGLINMGLDPSTLEEIEDPEQKEQMMAQIQAKKEEMTPPEIEKHMNTRWKTVARQFGENTLELDNQRFHMDEMRRNQYRNYLLTGRTFREHLVRVGDYQVRPWSVILTFFSTDLHNKHVEEGDYVGRLNYLTNAQIVKEYGWLMTGKEKEEVLNVNTSSSGSGESAKSYESLRKENFHTQHFEGFKGSSNYDYILALEDELGVPLGETTIRNKDGSEQVVPRYMPRRFQGQNGRNSYVYNQLRTELNMREDLKQCTEVYFKDFEKIGLLTYESESGTLLHEIVTEDIFPEFLKEHNITSTKSVKYKDAVQNPEPNTIVWEYRPVVKMAVKVQAESGDYYLGGDKLEYQIRKDGNIFDCLLPVSGFVGVGLGKLIDPYQKDYNLSMNQIRNLMEKEIGTFFLMDVNLLPSEYKEWGDTEDALYELTALAKDIGILPIDSRRQNIQDASGFNQFSVQQLTYSNQIASRLQTAQMSKQGAFDLIGVSPQRLGSPSKYETAEGVKVSQNASFAQTEDWFENFSGFEQRSLEIHLEVAKYAKSHNADISMYYTNSDLEQVYLKGHEPDLMMRNLGIMIHSNSKRRKSLLELKQYFLNTNTLGADEMAIAQLVSSDSVSEMVEIARIERLRKQQQQQQQHQQQMEQIQAQGEIEAKKVQDERAWISSENDKDRATKLEEERINALGRAADKDANQFSFDQINKEADQAIEFEKMSQEGSLAKERINLDKSKHESDKEEKRKRYELDLAETRRKIQESKDKRYIATINKN